MCPHLRGMILKSDLAARKRGLCVLLHRLQLVTQGTLNPAMVIGDVATYSVERGTVRGAPSKSSAEFKQWCHTSLAKGVAGAHALVRKV